MKKIFTLFIGLLSTSSFLKAGGTFRPHEADSEAITKKIGRHTEKAKDRNTSVQKAEYHATQISTLGELQKVKALPQGDELKPVMIESAAEAYVHKRKSKQKSQKLNVQEERREESLRFHSMNMINRDPGKYMVVGCYHGYQADDHSDHSHKGAITVNIPFENDPFMKDKAPNTANIKKDIADPEFLSDPGIRPLLGTLDTVYLEQITTEPLTKSRTYTNALALLKEGGKLYFDDYAQLGDEEMRILFREARLEKKSIEVKRLEFRLTNLGRLKAHLEKEYHLPIRDFQAFREGLNPFNHRAEGVLVMVEKGEAKPIVKQRSPQLVRREVSDISKYTPTESAREALDQVRSLITQGVIDPEKFDVKQIVEIVTDSTTFGSLQGQGLQWIEDQLK